MKRMVLRIPPLVLEWVEWTRWTDLQLHTRGEGGVSIPTEPGVYEVCRKGRTGLLLIGMASNLRHRLKQALVKGKAPYGARKKLMKGERGRFHQVWIRWAITDRPAAAEEELFRRYRRRFGRQPKYSAVG